LAVIRAGANIPLALNFLLVDDLVDQAVFLGLFG
jgi:hypothetical protein